ncbi:MAG: BACON domain-containing protein, partial [Firmicutes bacterium]|nr:BACON domain-containing protein [Bacillota bacterium]
MKRIFLLLAAVAAFASCVKENDLVPDQPETQADNIVTLKATSSDTKAVLDGADVLWYGEETVEVVLQKSGSPAYNIELTANVDEAIKNATFTGEISEEAKNDTGLEETGWAVYPNTAVPEPWDGFLQYTLPETQNGTDIAHISSARVNTADIQAGAANASFNNFLTLLKITVPEGVNEVSLTANYGIVGTANLNKPDAEGKLSVNSYSSKKTVTLSTGSELDPGTVYSVLVFPGTAETLTLSMTGNDSNDVYESTLNNVELRPGTYRTIDLTEVFAMGVQAGAEIEISSVGGEKVISVADAAGYTYTVEESADWLEAEVLETRSFSGKDIVLTATANLTGSSRSTDVTVSWSDQSRTFTVSQEGISSDYLEFVYVDPTDPENSELIQWEETFDIFGEETLDNKITASPYKGVFTIEINEENPEKGTYIVKNIF